MPVVKTEHDAVGRRLFPVMPAQNPRGADHARTVPPQVSVIARRPFPA
jgi:hypothetical protein